MQLSYVNFILHRNRNKSPTFLCTVGLWVSLPGLSSCSFYSTLFFLDGCNFSYGILLLERSVDCCASRRTEFFFSLARKLTQTETRIL